MAQLECVVVETAARTKKSVIWLHGLGADGRDFEPIVPELRLAGVPGVRFVFPHAPVRPVTINNHMRMRAWYDIISLDRQGRPDEAGIRQSASQVESLLRRELEDGRDAADIVLAGFSQGGAVALHTGLRYPARLAGIMGLSTYLPLTKALADEAADVNKTTPIFMAHGREDPVLPIDMGADSRDILRQHGYAVEWRDYPMAHQVCPQEIEEIARWLSDVLGSAARSSPPPATRA